MKTSTIRLTIIITIITSYSLFFSTYSIACFDSENSSKPLPILSGPVTVLPWDNDEKFLTVRTANKANNLIAAYKTVLLDPLPGEETNVYLAARLLCGTVVKENTVFSMNKTIGPYTVNRGFKKGPTYAGTKLITTTGGGICKIATTLYNTAVLSNLPIIERHYHNMPVSYVPYGQDATVYYGSYDFKFKNNTSSPILIWAKGIEDTLYIGFYGSYIPPKVEWQHETLDKITTTTIYQKSKNLPHGTRRTAVHGMDGRKVNSSVVITYPDGKKEIKKMGISNYKPLPYIIEIGK